MEREKPLFKLACYCAPVVSLSHGPAGLSVWELRLFIPALWRLNQWQFLKLVGDLLAQIAVMFGARYWAMMKFRRIATANVTKARLNRPRGTIQV